MAYLLMDWREAHVETGTEQSMTKGNGEESELRRIWRGDTPSAAGAATAMAACTVETAAQVVPFRPGDAPAVLFAYAAPCRWLHPWRSASIWAMASDTLLPRDHRRSRHELRPDAI